MFPLKEYKYTIPDGEHPGAFGVVRRYDVHTGVDLYCNPGDNVYAIEAGIVSRIERFTGEWADSPWWNNTQAIVVQGKSGSILYGEIDVSFDFIPGLNIEEGAILGRVQTVLKEDKGKPLTMLHMELYSKTIPSVWWKLNEPKPEYLEDITGILKKELMDEALR